MNERLADIMRNNKPLCFRDTKDNVLTELEKSHTKLCVTLAEAGCPDPFNLTVFQLNAWMETLEEKYESQKAALKKK